MSGKKYSYQLIDMLISLGLNRRSLRLLFLFINLFIFGSTIFIYTIDLNSIALWLGSLIPLIVIDCFVAVIILNKESKLYFIATEKLINGKLVNKTIGRKLYIGMACFGTFLGLTGLLVVVLALAGIYVDKVYDNMGYILISWFIVGPPFITMILWKYYSQRLR